jgi:hypothetical protein
LPRQIRKFVRALFGGGGTSSSLDDDVEGGVGVREPRRPLAPTLSGAAVLDLPGSEETS